MELRILLRTSRDKDDSSIVLSAKRGSRSLRFFSILPPVIGTSGLGCSFRHEGTNTVTSVCPRSRKKFTVSWIPRHEKTSLLPWLQQTGTRGSNKKPENSHLSSLNLRSWIIAGAVKNNHRSFYTSLYVGLEDTFNSHK